jgi:fructose-specific phosphotransferase system IIC component
VFALLVPALVVGFAVLITRRRGLVAEAQAHEPGLRPCLVGALVAGGLGFALNDSGVAIPAMMIAMVVPWLLLLVFRSVPER